MQLHLTDRALRRWSWAAALIFVVSIALTGVVDALSTSSTRDWGGSGFWQSLGETVLLSLFPLVGLLITQQQPRNRIGWLMHAIGFTWAVAALIGSYSVLALSVSPGLHGR